MPTLQFCGCGVVSDIEFARQRGRHDRVREASAVLTIEMDVKEREGGGPQQEPAHKHELQPAMGPTPAVVRCGGVIHESDAI